MPATAELAPGGGAPSLDVTPSPALPVTHNHADLSDHDVTPSGPGREPLPDVAHRSSAPGPFSGTRTSPVFSSPRTDSDPISVSPPSSAQPATFDRPVSLDSNPVDVPTSNSPGHADSPSGADSTDALDNQTGRTGSLVPFTVNPDASRQSHQPALGEGNHPAPEGVAQTSVGNPNDLFVDDDEFVTPVTSPIHESPMLQQAASAEIDGSGTLQQVVPEPLAAQAGDTSFADDLESPLSQADAPPVFTTTDNALTADDKAETVIPSEHATTTDTTGENPIFTEQKPERATSESAEERPAADANKVQSRATGDELQTNGSKNPAENDGQKPPDPVRDAIHGIFANLVDEVSKRDPEAAHKILSLQRNQLDSAFKEYQSQVASREGTSSTLAENSSTNLYVTDGGPDMENPRHGQFDSIFHDFLVNWLHFDFLRDDYDRACEAWKLAHPYILP